MRYQPEVMRAARLLRWLTAGVLITNQDQVSTYVITWGWG